MYASKDSNTLWISSQQGIYAIDQTKRTSKYYHPSGLKNQTIRQIAEDKDGNLWLGTENKGIYKWVSGNGKIDFSQNPVPVLSIPEVQINKLPLTPRSDLDCNPETGLYVIDPVSDKLLMHFSGQESPPFQLPESGISRYWNMMTSTLIITTATHVVKIQQDNESYFTHWKIRHHLGIYSGR